MRDIKIKFNKTGENSKKPPYSIGMGAFVL